MEIEKIEYVLTQRIITLTRTNTTIKRNIASALGMEPRSVYEILINNKPNNSLTLAAGIDALSKETGLMRDDIIEQVKEKVN